MATLDNRLLKLEKKHKPRAIYPNGCTKAELVTEIPENRREDTFYVLLVRDNWKAGDPKK